MNTKDTLSAKEKTQYGTAIAALASGIIMCFLSFFLNKYSIEESALMYCGEMIIFCSGVFGVNLYIKNKVLEAEARINNKIDRKMKKVDDLITDQN